jgi:hypothetical protein
VEYLVGLAAALSPSIIAQARGHKSATQIIGLNLAAPFLFFGPVFGVLPVPQGSPLVPFLWLGAIASWLGAFLWSLGR